MSIILKGIDMPRKGTNIVLTLYGRDGTYDARTYPSGPRIKGEAIQIPKGHGDILAILAPHWLCGRRWCLLIGISFLSLFFHIPIFVSIR